MDEAEEILKKFLELVVHPECYSGIFPNEKEQQALG